jgi:CheY-like chemotaxis protein
MADAVDLIEHGPQLDGALLDINLNGEMVYPAAAALKMKRVPFAFVTAYEDRMLPASYRGAKVFTKPASWATIASYLAHGGGTDKLSYPVEMQIGA